MFVGVGAHTIDRAPVGRGGGCFSFREIRVENQAPHGWLLRIQAQQRQADMRRWDRFMDRD
jgi:hypothetical protein